MDKAPSRGTASSGPTFGLTRQQPTRVEIVFVFKTGGSLTVSHHLGEPATEERVSAFAEELSGQLGGQAEPRLFSDEWGATGQRAWVDLSQVAAFSLRPAR